MRGKEGRGAEEKARIVRRILKWEISISAAGQAVGVGRETIRGGMSRVGKCIGNGPMEGFRGILTPMEKHELYLAA